MHSPSKDPESSAEYVPEDIVFIRLDFPSLSITQFTRFIEAMVKASSFGDSSGVRKLVDAIHRQGLGMNSDVRIQVPIHGLARSYSHSHLFS